MIALLLITGFAYAALPVAVGGKPLPSLAPVLKQVTPSVVNVYTQTRVRVSSPLLDDPIFRRFFNVPDVPRERVSQSLGSGVIVNAEKGYILTNNHVIAHADEIAVGLKDGRNFEAKLIGTDPDTDIAVIQIKANNLEALPLADSDRLQVGDFVVAVGNPFGLGQTVTSGIVSALGRTGLRGLQYQNFIQTDASINPGNSGGALINLRGELVGINSAIFTPSGGNVGIGFAIPSKMALYVMEQLIRYGEVRRGTLGLTVQDLTPDLAGAFSMDSGSGALVAQVAAGSAAEKAGLKPGDVVVSIAGHPVKNARDFYNSEGQLALGQSLRVDYVREGQSRNVTLVIKPIPTLKGEDLDARFKGARFSELGANLKQEDYSGVLLDQLDPKSRLAYQGLAKGDIITGVNRQRIRNLNDFKASLENLRGTIYLQIVRGQRTYVARIE